MGKVCHTSPLWRFPLLTEAQLTVAFSSKGKGVLVSVLAPRVRIVAMRLSEEEYSAVERFCLDSGARSMSDLARTAILGLIPPAVKRSTWGSSSRRNAVQLQTLERRIEVLSREIAAIKATGVGEAARRVPKATARYTERRTNPRFGARRSSVPR